ncbi:bifunctional folylpolyglutamate synthase/dihydrofolate synthase [Flavihumibacter petaseus]|uniref:Dihydrofolate synthase/folylpolyglutamate synthase n=1 Tax=Flavihumibacter petaseus NBRC 106054 TaxID=1220578 RepID=A0A0E9N3D0_9BACT|nr:folylpolyglutamate synthase/dihydrofolate synthase family protein [Flavihumibacter petaseus]GAO44467.1 folylpolyglutamate synthase [Flavihumibacter petaseus NBRC 106054]
MDYTASLSFLYSRLPMFSKLGADAYKKDLHNILALEEKLGNNYRKFKSIHVAGTNGKGSTSHMLAAVLQEAGYKTGLLTSPHLHDFRERIRINGQMIPESFVAAFTTNSIPLIDAIEPSFFELTVSMAFAWFAQENIEVAVIETGLGGRLDSTNIVTPEISIITNIGLDHQNILGPDLATIAGEKAGIIKQGVPVVIGEANAETLPVFEAVAKSKQAPMSVASEAQQLIQWGKNGNRLDATVRDTDRTDGHQYQLDLTGEYQTRNLLTVLQAIRILQRAGWNINEKAIQSGLSQTRKLTGLHGRWEQISESPRVILDVGHNADGIRAIVRQLGLETFAHLHIVIGMVKDKDISAALELLPKTATYYFTAANIPRALPADELALKAGSYGLSGRSWPDVNQALNAAKAKAGKNDLVLVCGSVFIVGEVTW